MKVNVLEILRDYEGNNIKNSDDKFFTLRDAIFIALNSQLPNDVVTAEDKSKMYQLSIKLFKGKEVELTLDDRSFIKNRAGKFLSALVYGRLCDIFEGKVNEKEEKVA